MLMHIQVEPSQFLQALTPPYDLFWAPPPILLLQSCVESWWCWAHALVPSEGAQKLLGIFLLESRNVLGLERATLESTQDFRVCLVWGIQFHISFDYKSIYKEDAFGWSGAVFYQRNTIPWNTLKCTALSTLDARRLSLSRLWRMQTTASWQSSTSRFPATRQAPWLRTWQTTWAQVRGPASASRCARAAWVQDFQNPHKMMMIPVKGFRQLLTMI